MYPPSRELSTDYIAQAEIQMNEKWVLLAIGCKEQSLMLNMYGTYLKLVLMVRSASDV